jgi:hypothetical protein
MAGERNLFMAAAKTAFQGLEKGTTLGPFTINYNPTHVLRVRSWDEAFLDTVRDLTYFLIPGEEIDEPDTNYEFLARWEVFIIGVIPFKPDRENPFHYHGEDPDSIQNKVIDDIKAAITSVGADPPSGVENVDPVDFRLGGADYQPFLWVECRTMVEYEWQAVT